MSQSCNVVSIHPYFKVHPGKMAAVKAMLPMLNEKVAKETKNLYYDFTFNGDEMFCREAYLGSEGVLEHLTNVGAMVGEILKLAALIRIEVHGPAAELEKLKGPMAGLKPVWFVYECGVKR